MGSFDIFYGVEFRGNFTRTIKFLLAIYLLISYCRTKAIDPEADLIIEKVPHNISNLLMITSRNDISTLVALISRTTKEPSTFCLLKGFSTFKIDVNRKNSSHWDSYMCSLISRVWNATYRNDHCRRSNITAGADEIRSLFNSSRVDSSTIMRLLTKKEHEGNNGSDGVVVDARKIALDVIIIKLTKLTLKDISGVSSRGIHHTKEVKEDLEVVVCHQRSCTEPRSLSCNCSQFPLKGSFCQPLSTRTKRDTSVSKCQGLKIAWAINKRWKSFDVETTAHENLLNADIQANTCLNGGTCIQAVGKLVCKCTANFRGERCENSSNSCTSNPCKNGGSCFDLPKSFKCCCPEKYVGIFCEREKLPCDYENCLNGGTCTNVGKEIQCRCPVGVSGKRCEINLEIQTDYQVEFSGYTDQYIKLQNQRHLTAVTVAFWMKSDFKDQNNRGTPFSYSYQNPYTKAEETNALTLYDTNKFLLYIHGNKIITDIVGNRDNGWHHCAVTWESENGEWALYWDGELKKHGSQVANGSRLWSGYFVIGQEQDSLGGTFSLLESYKGVISQFNVWDHAVQKDKIDLLRSNCGISGNVLSWGGIRAMGGKGPLSKLMKDTNLCSDIGTCSKKNCYCNRAELLQNEKCWRNLPTCNPNPCANGHKCVRKNGLSQCNCGKDFEGIRCQYDIDECLTNNGNCSEKCINLKGSYKCSCRNGKRLASDDRQCLDPAYCYRTSGGYNLIMDNGDTWEEGCQNCKCDRGEVICNPKSCPKINCQPNEKEVISTDKCCTSCVIDESHCNHRGRIYVNNDTWTDGCSLCSCNKGGVKCKTSSCPPLSCKVDEIDVLLPFNCCRKCIKEQSFCRVNGQEIHTFDGLRYTFSGRLSQTVVDDCGSDEISIQREISPYNAKDNELFIYYKCLKVEVYSKHSKGLVLIEEEEADLPYTDNRFIVMNGSLSSNDVNVFVTLANGMIIRWEARKTEIWSPPEYKGRLCGLCGNFNGKDSDDQPELSTEMELSRNTDLLESVTNATVSPNDSSRLLVEGQHELNSTEKEVAVLHGVTREMDYLHPQPTESSSAPYSRIMAKKCILYILTDTILICSLSLFTWQYFIYI